MVQDAKCVAADTSDGIAAARWRESNNAVSSLESSLEKKYKKIF